MTIERTEFNAAMERIHAKLDENKDHFNTKIESVSSEVVELRTKFDMTPIPQLPNRPCKFFIKHEAEHDAIRFVWVKAVIGAIVSGIAAAIGTVLFFGHHKGQ